MTNYKIQIIFDELQILNTNDELQIIIPNQQNKLGNS